MSAPDTIASAAYLDFGIIVGDGPVPYSRSSKVLCRLLVPRPRERMLECASRDAGPRVPSADAGLPVNAPRRGKARPGPVRRGQGPARPRADPAEPARGLRPPSCRERSTIHTESMNLSQFRGEGYDRLLADHYRRKYADRKPDLLVAVMGPSLDFLLRHGESLFPGTPIVFCGADASDIEGKTLPANVTGVAPEAVLRPDARDRAPAPAGHARTSSWCPGPRRSTASWRPSRVRDLAALRRPPDHHLPRGPPHGRSARSRLASLPPQQPRPLHDHLHRRRGPCVRPPRRALADRGDRQRPGVRVRRPVPGPRHGGRPRLHRRPARPAAPRRWRCASCAARPRRPSPSSTRPPHRDIFDWRQLDAVAARRVAAASRQRGPLPSDVGLDPLPALHRGRRRPRCCCRPPSSSAC